MTATNRLALTLSIVSALSPFASIASADRAYEPQFPPAPIAPARASTHRFAQPPPPQGDVPSAPAYTGSDVVLDRAHVRAALADRRARSLTAFRTYRTTGVFPSNVYQGKTLNVWRDEGGHFCAAATIIRMSGQDQLVDRVADQNNFIRLADVTTGPLMDWMLTSGLTKEELVMIQVPFEPVARHPQPVHTPKVDPDLRIAETARLRKLYAVIDAKLIASQASSLDVATDRLMKRPQLAWTLLE